MKTNSATRCVLLSHEESLPKKKQILCLSLWKTKQPSLSLCVSLSFFLSLSVSLDSFASDIDSATVFKNNAATQCQAGASGKGSGCTDNGVCVCFCVSCLYSYPSRVRRDTLDDLHQPSRYVCSFSYFREEHITSLSLYVEDRASLSKRPLSPSLSD